MAKIAILGFGTVGSGVYEVLKTNYTSIVKKAGEDIEIKYILDIRDFSDFPDSHLFTKNFEDIISDDEISVVVEVMGGLKPAYDFTKRLLLKGVSVVTSNKELVATKGSELLKIAKEKNVNYMFEASVGGGIPIIRPLTNCLSANEITSVTGILNGTTNYILTQMFKFGKDFKTALEDATIKGYAEKDPTADVEGHDACRKIAILSSLVFGKNVSFEKIYTLGISDITLDDVKYAEAKNSVIKLIAQSRIIDGKVYASVEPALVPDGHPLSGIEGVFNGILVEGNVIGDVMFYGRGAGKLPTASAVVADIVDCIKGKNEPTKFFWEDSDSEFVKAYDENTNRYFVIVKGALKDNIGKINTLFPNAETISIKDTEFAFVSPNIKVKELNTLLKDINVSKKIKMI